MHFYCAPPLLLFVEEKQWAVGILFKLASGETSTRGQGRDSIGLKLTGVHFRAHFGAHFRCKIHLGAF